MREPEARYEVSLRGGRPLVARMEQERSLGRREERHRLQERPVVLDVRAVPDDRDHEAPSRDMELGSSVCPETRLEGSKRVAIEPVVDERRVDAEPALLVLLHGTADRHLHDAHATHQLSLDEAPDAEVSREVEEGVDRLQHDRRSGSARCERQPEGRAFRVDVDGVEAAPRDPEHVQEEARGLPERDVVNRVAGLRECVAVGADGSPGAHHLAADAVLAERLGRDHEHALRARCAKLPEDVKHVRPTAFHACSRIVIEAPRGRRGRGGPLLAGHRLTVRQRCASRGAMVLDLRPRCAGTRGTPRANGTWVCADLMTSVQQTARERSPTHTPCPACGQPDQVEEMTVAADEAAQHFVLREFDGARHDALAAHIRSLWGGDTCALVRCAGCGCRFTVPFVGGDEAFYALAYERTGYPSNKWEYRRAVEIIGALPPARRRLLEIGAGDGAFVAKVSPSLFRREDVVATEFSDYGLEALRGLGVTALKRDFRTLTPEACGGAFDVVCLFQVLEHLDDLDGTFAKLRDLCAGGGIVVLTTPSDARISFNEANGALLDMPPNHVTLWRREAFARLAARHGFVLVEHAYEPRAPSAEAVQYLKYRFLRAAQRHGSWPNAIGALRDARLRKVLSAAWLACSLPARIPALGRLRRLPSGESQLAVLARAQGHAPAAG